MIFIFDYFINKKVASFDLLFIPFGIIKHNTSPSPVNSVGDKAERMPKILPKARRCSKCISTIAANGVVFHRVLFEFH